MACYIRAYKLQVLLQNLSNLEYIPKLNLEEIHKYEICIEVKFAKNSFHSIDRNTKPLGLIHNNM